MESEKTQSFLSCQMGKQEKRCPRKSPHRESKHRTRGLKKRAKKTRAHKTRAHKARVHKARVQKIRAQKIRRRLSCTANRSGFVFGRLYRKRDSASGGRWITGGRISYSAEGNWVGGNGKNTPGRNTGCTVKHRSR